jgi:hypothetical protein
MKDLIPIDGQAAGSGSPPSPEHNPAALVSIPPASVSQTASTPALPADSQSSASGEHDAGDARLIESFTTSAGQLSMPSTTMSAAVAWFQEVRGGDDVGHAPPQHAYDLRNFHHSFAEDDLPLLTDFLNAMARANASQSDVTLALEWYLRTFIADPSNHAQQAAIAHDFDARDAADRDRTRTHIQAEWDDAYATNIQLINDYLGTLPAAEREAIESGERADGSLQLNDPAYLRTLLQTAHANERTTLESMMGNRSSAYWRGPQAARLQERYRELIKAGS